MKAVIVFVVILLILAFVLGGAYFNRRNQMAIKREAVNAAWAQVDVVLQRRGSRGAHRRQNTGRQDRRQRPARFCA